MVTAYQVHPFFFYIVVTVANLRRFLDPIFFGDYPQSMRDRVGLRLPNFTAEEIAKVNGSLDFIGLNIQTAFYVYDKDYYTDAVEDKKCYYLDWGVDVTGERDGVPIGEVNLQDFHFICTIVKLFLC